MHEMSIAMHIIEIASRAIPPGMAGARVEAINLRVGRLSSVVPETLRYCFDAAVAGTPMHGAVLNCDLIPIAVACRACDARSEQVAFPFSCPDCECTDVDLVSGRELLVVSVEFTERA